MLRKYKRTRPLKRAVLREEFVVLTGSPLRALVLNQFLYWTGRFFEWDHIIVEEKIGAAQMGRTSPHDFYVPKMKPGFLNAWSI